MARLLVTQAGQMREFFFKFADFWTGKRWPRWAAGLVTLALILVSGLIVFQLGQFRSLIGRPLLVSQPAVDQQSPSVTPSSLLSVRSSPSQMVASPTLSPSPSSSAPASPSRSLIFFESELAPYDTWTESQAVVGRFGIDFQIVEGTAAPRALTAEEQAVYQATATAFAYLLETTFSGTKLGDYLERVDLCVKGCSSTNWGNVIRITPLASGEDRDRYIILALHELAHSFGLLPSRDDFRTICWVPAAQGIWYDDKPEKKLECTDEAAFIPQSLTSDKGRGGSGYYSASHYQEDLAETITAYRVSGPEFRALLVTRPLLTQKYAFVRDQVFAGREF